MSEFKELSSDKSIFLAGDDDDNNLPLSGHDLELPAEVPIVGLENFVLFPSMIAPMIVVEEHAKQMVADALNGDRLAGFFLKRDPDKPESFDNLHQAGTLGLMLKMLRMPDGAIRLLVQGLERVRLDEVTRSEPYLNGRIDSLEVSNADSRVTRALMKQIQAQMERIGEMGQLPEDFATVISGVDDPAKLGDLAIGHLAIKREQRQEVLAMSDLEKRLERVLEILMREANLLEIGSEIMSKVSQRMDERQREYFLREQQKLISRELGDEEGENPEAAELEQAVAEAAMPEQAEKAARKELERLARLHMSSPEYAVVRNYLDWLVSLPWDKASEDLTDVARARQVLDEDHYGLRDVKDRILEFLAVIALKKEVRGSILCLVGPPGVGKTSVGRSIARALGRQFVSISLGGMRDEAEIRGHRRTYIGSMPGRVIKSIRDAGTRNPLIMLDEIDKLGADFRGDPASALLEVLDPEQNAQFTDHYLDLPFDLSRVLFITTANTLEPIPQPLLDRMEVIRLSGYTVREKEEIAKQYLLPRSLERSGLETDAVSIDDDALQTLIERYTREAGVRNLERELLSILRKVALRRAEGNDGKVCIDADRVERLLGPPRVFSEMADRAGQPGVAVGLAWTPFGGEILFIEASAVQGTGKLTLTGQLGEVMKESAMAALNYLHANARKLQLPDRVFAQSDLHVHVPAGATPKDGPSAGVAIAVALYSLLKGVPVKERTAMTGEITLKGQVLQVGGIKEKIIAAHRAGVQEVLLPSRCQATLRKDVPQEVQDALRFRYADEVGEVLAAAFPGVLRDFHPQPRTREEREDASERRRSAQSYSASRDRMVARPALRIEPDEKAGGKQAAKGRRERQEQQKIQEELDDLERAWADEVDERVVNEELVEELEGLDGTPDKEPEAEKQSTGDKKTESDDEQSGERGSKRRGRRRRGGRGRRGRRSGGEDQSADRDQQSEATAEASKTERKDKTQPAKPETTDSAKPDEKATEDRTDSRRRRRRRPSDRRGDSPRSEEKPTPAPDSGDRNKEQAPPPRPAASAPERQQTAPAPETPAPQPEAQAPEKAPVKKAAKKAVKKAAAKKAVKKAAKKTTKKAAKKTAKKAVKKAAKKSVKKAVKKSVKKAAKKTVKKTAKKAVKKSAGGSDGGEG